MKKEEVYRTRSVNFEEVRSATIRYIEGWCNGKRIQRSIGYLVPDAFVEICRSAS